ncbi:MAG: InlB B-repeat-containing protein [Spirochaetales bacterium]|nr:InlB B-repeat-containing protein [Spirochaetales bacterium]
MLLKKSESFLLILTLGLFLFSCTVEQNRKRSDSNSKLAGDEYKVTIEIVNTQSIEKSYFKFEGTLDGNPIYIPDDTAGIGKQEIQLASNGKLRVTVRAYSFASGEITATGYAEKDISGNISFEIMLKKVADDKLFYLTFYNEGQVNTISYSENELVGEFANPTRDGYIFQGWFTQRNGEGTKLTSNHIMTEDLFVYAYWTSANSNEQFVVTFNTNGGSTVASRTVTANNTIDAPASPTKDGYSFTGWYSDEQCTALVNFPYTVTKNVTLYAGWVSSDRVIKVTSVVLTETSYTFDSIDKIKSLTCVIVPTNATNKSVSWSSSNPNVAKVNNGEVTSVSAGTAIITVTTADGGYTATCSITVKGEQEIAVTGVTLNETTKSLEKGATFTLTATVSPENATNKSVKWTTSNPSVATVNGGKVTAIAKGTATITATTTDGAKNASCYVTVTSPLDGKLIIFVKSTSAPYIWAWEDNGTALSEAIEKWETQKEAETVPSNYMNDPTGWWMKVFPSDKVSLTGKGNIIFILDKNDKQKRDSGKKATFWYDGTKYYDEDPTTPVIVEPTKPTVSISPASGNISVGGSVRVTFTDGNDTITSARVTINGSSYDMGTIAGTFTKSVNDLGINSVGTSLSVKATVTNNVGTTTAEATLTTTDTIAEDTFTWDNVNAYFVLTDRFYNGDKNNDYSYHRQNKSTKSSLSEDENVATFHGGDLKGLTEKIDYFDKLGVNAIWITAPYEQAHGWVGGKDGKFPHYAFHGYYTLDWTALDANMGTLDEFREFVVACHERGIRVIMDVVMNHVGYNNQTDMITYKHGKTSNTNPAWLEKTNGKWDANVGVDWDHQYWDSSWWGPWARSFGYATGSEYGGPCGGLPDIKSEITTSVGMAPVMVTKWKTDSADIKAKYYNPSVANADWNGYKGDYRTDKGIAPADYQVVWLSAWVREFGIDGFRCDTAKHVEPYRWGQLKVACQAALEAWRKDSSKKDDSGAKGWDESFWMTGECWGWTNINGGGEYYSTGKFDSMINFSFNGGNNWDGNYRTRYPGTSDWSSYLSINRNGDSDGNGHRDNVLSYISSHDTGLTRVGDQYEVGTGLVLLPGGVQIYYGDESYRGKAYTGCGDGDMYTRGDMNWNYDEKLVAHWGKVGTFRKYNPAVGAGTGSAYKRTYSGAAGESKVAIGVNGSSVDVSGLFDDGTTVYNWYDGNSATVSGGKVTSFSGGTMKQPILISDKNPADFR